MLTDAEVRAILRIAGRPGVLELHVETDGLELRLRRGSAMTPSGGEVVSAPMLGRFRRRIELGSAVAPRTVVGQIEVLQSANDVEAGVSGTVVELLAEDALVEYGQPLLRVVAAD